LVSRAIVSNQIGDIYAGAGLNKPDIGLVAVEFLAEPRCLPQKHLALEMLS
jgi:hypothetical protein